MQVANAITSFSLYKFPVSWRTPRKICIIPTVQLVCCFECSRCISPGVQTSFLPEVFITHRMQWWIDLAGRAFTASSHAVLWAHRSNHEKEGSCSPGPGRRHSEGLSLIEPNWNKLPLRMCGSLQGHSNPTSCSGIWPGSFEWPQFFFLSTNNHDSWCLVKIAATAVPELEWFLSDAGCSGALPPPQSGSAALIRRQDADATLCSLHRDWCTWADYNRSGMDISCVLILI